VDMSKAPRSFSAGAVNIFSVMGRLMYGARSVMSAAIGFFRQGFIRPGHASVSVVSFRALVGHPHMRVGIGQSYSAACALILGA
jgi:hypothetical protein